MNLSIVVPVFNEPQTNIGDLYNRITGVCRSYEYGYEIIFVDDGSSNGISDFIKKLQYSDKNVRLIRFIKNCGQAKAFLAGFSFAKGDFIITMDSDLQYLPEEIPLFLEQVNSGHDVVGGKRPDSSRSLLSKFLAFYFSTFYGIRMKDHTCTYGVLSSGIAKKILKNQASVCIRHLAYIFGNNKTEIDITHCERKYGKTSYPLFKYLFHGARYLFTFSKAQKMGPDDFLKFDNICEQIA